VWDGTTWLDGHDAVNYLLHAQFTTGFDLPKAAEKYLKIQPEPKAPKDPILTGTELGKNTAVGAHGVLDVDFSIALLQDALNYYTCENLQNPEIIAVGGALKELGDTTGLQMWMEWLDAPKHPYWRDVSENASSYTEEYWLKKWAYFDPERNKPGYIINKAKEAGWNSKVRARTIGARIRAARSRAMGASKPMGPKW